MADPILNPATTAVVVIDLQKGIVGRATAPHPAATVVANTVRLLRAARRAGATPVLVHVGGFPDGRDRLNPTAHEHCLTRIFPRMGRVRDTQAVAAALGG